MTLLRLFQYTTFILPCECLPSSCSYSNLCAKVVCSADGRGDEKEPQQRSQVHLDTSHAFSILFSIPSIHELPQCKEREEDQTPGQGDLSECLRGGNRLEYKPNNVPDTLRDITYMKTIKSDNIRVWNLVQKAPVEEFEGPQTGFSDCQINCNRFNRLANVIQQMDDSGHGLVEMDNRGDHHDDRDVKAVDDQQQCIYVEKPRGYQKTILVFSLSQSRVQRQAIMKKDMQENTRSGSVT